MTSAPRSGGFSYHLRPVEIVFGVGTLERLRDVIAKAGIERALLVSTPGRHADAEAARRVLGETAVAVFDGAQPHVPTSVVSVAVDLIDQTGPDGTVALGGGSAIGLGKAIALKRGLPLVAIPTTYSGSEMTAVWGITQDDRKETGRNEGVAPRAVVYDPSLTVTLPADVSAASGMNAIAHCVEALYALDAHPIASLFAREGIRVLARSLRHVLGDPADPGARASALYGAHLAGRALDLTSMGLHHRLCHVLGGTFGLPHAVTHAVLLPYVTAYNSRAAGRAMTLIAEALGTEKAWTGLYALRRTLGLPDSLRDLGLAAEDLDRAAELASAAGGPNPRQVTRDGVRELLEAAYEGAPL